MITRVIVGALVIACVVTAIGVVEARHQHRQLFVQLSKLTHARDELNVDFGRLQLEQATWAENNRIEQIARGKLGMVSPGVTETVVIKR